MSDVLSAADVQELAWLPAKLRDEAEYFGAEPVVIEGAKAEEALARYLNEAADALVAFARSHEQLRGERDAAAEREQQYHNLWHDETDRAEAAARAGGCAAYKVIEIRPFRPRTWRETIVIAWGVDIFVWQIPLLKLFIALTLALNVLFWWLLS